VTSVKKIRANRANAKFSTGPATERGKSHARRNALKFGVFATARTLPGEDAIAHDELFAEIFETAKPCGPIEVVIVTRMAECIWQIGRYKQAEYAALRRAELASVLDELAKATERAYEAEGVLDTHLRADLANDGPAMPFELSDRVPSMEEDTQANAELADNSVRAGSPPVSLLFYRAFRAGVYNRDLAELDGQIDTRISRLLRLQSELDALQRKRVKQSVPGTETDSQLSASSA